MNGTSGADSNAGTKEAPVKSIAGALSKASGSKNNVYICAGSYAEHVKITSAVNLYGGFACADWSYATTNRSKIAPSDAGYALDVESVSSAIAIQDLEFDSIDGKNPGDSSIAIFLNESNVAFTRATISAGAGVTGAPGVLTDLTFPDAGALRGNDAVVNTGGLAQSVVCPGDAGTTVGGKGGDIGLQGDPGMPSLGAGDAGAIAACGSGGTGGDGAGASSIANGDGAKSTGEISTIGWTASAGSNGNPGNVGQGGGGGYGTAGAGGGGGAGGCGGSGGGGGFGGGASIAILSNASTVNVISSNLSTKTAGNGGAGVAGQPGESPGGFGGNRSGGACNGGNGGAGGAGGAGGGGAGGLSVGVLYKGTALTIDSATTSGTSVASSGGTKGPGGIAGTNDGVAGAAQPTLEIK